MGIRIHQLPPAIANQIAAGEVIERPASIVKELLENALDAGADSISIEIGYGGLNQIKVSDNGIGIDGEDLPLAIAAHATSKISSLDDLYSISSMGFRGEALASIASIAKLSISSKPAHQEMAMMLEVSGSNYQILPCVRAEGTTIDVRDIFYNAPVRKRFLKSEKIEYQAIETVVKRFALSAPKVAISLKHNGKNTLSLSQAFTEKAQLARMARIFGAGFSKEAHYIDVEAGEMRLTGWISGLGFQRSQNDRLWFYVNQRMVKDKLINHALKQAYEGMLHPGRFPLCLLYLTINPSEVDVNVHPTKHELRFQQPRLVHDFINSHVSKAIHRSVSTLEYDPIHCLDSKNTIFEPSTQSFIYQPQIPHQPGFDASSENLIREQHSTSLLRSTHSTDHLEKNWIYLNKEYSLIFIRELPYLVNVPTLYQSWLKEQIKTLSKPFAHRPLLVPIHYSLEKSLKYSLDELKCSLNALGISIEMKSASEIHIKTVPLIFPYLDLQNFIDKAVELNEVSIDSLIVLLCQSQLCALEFLSPDERTNLGHFLHKLVEKNEHKEMARLLDIEFCRNCIHEH